MQSIDQRIVDLVEEWQDYCFPDKVEICKPKVSDLINELDQLLEKCQENKKQKAKLYYLKGKIMDLLPVYEKAAQQFLNKSIKLNPGNGDCWNVLAHVLFKKQDYEGASKAIEMALSTKGKNKVSLRYQSVLMRTQGKLEEDRRKNIEESVKVIKEALMLDMKDWLTWYFLGNAYFSSYVANFKKLQQLTNALKAYNEAEKYLKHKYPDLYLNRANVEKHLEEYEKAMNDFKIVDDIDKSLGASQFIELIRNRMEYTKVSFDRMGELKSAKVSDMIKTIPNSVNKQDRQEKLEILSISNMKPEYNVGKMLSGKVINKLTKDNDIPDSFLVMDSEGKILSVSLYNISKNIIQQKIQKDSLLTIKDPYVKHVNFEGFEYDTVQVFDITKIWIDKVRVSGKDFNPNVVYNETFEK